MLRHSQPCVLRAMGTWQQTLGCWRRFRQPLHGILWIHFYDWNELRIRHTNFPSGWLRQYRALWSLLKSREIYCHAVISAGLYLLYFHVRYHHLSWSGARSSILCSAIHICLFAWAILLRIGLMPNQVSKQSRKDPDSHDNARNFHDFSSYMELLFCLEMWTWHCWHWDHRCHY